MRLVSHNANDDFSPLSGAAGNGAWQYRKTVLRPEELTCCRIVFGKADHFPGLTVDRFGPLSGPGAQRGHGASERPSLPQLVELLREDGQEITGVYERNDVAIRTLEGLGKLQGLVPRSGAAHARFAAGRDRGKRRQVHRGRGKRAEDQAFPGPKYNRAAVARLAQRAKPFWTASPTRASP